MYQFKGRETVDSKLEKPFRLIIGGGSGTGKTTFLQRLVNEGHFSSPFEKIVYCYPDYLIDPPVEFDPIVDFRPGIGDLEFYSSLPKNTLIILDDLMSECGESKDIMKLFTVIARKRQLSIIFLVQNMFDKSKQFRNIRLNATNLVLFKFHAAKDVPKRILKDLDMDALITSRSLDNIFKNPYAYIMFDIHPNRQSDFGCIKANIFERNFSIFHKMEYIAIPKTEFLKHFTIQEAKSDTIRQIKDEIEIREKPKRRRKNKTKKAKRRRKYTESSEETDRNSSSAIDSASSY